MVKKRINTILDEDLWKQAILKDVKWVNALEIGVKALTGVNTEKDELIKEKQEKEAELMVIRQKLKKMEEESELVKEKEKQTVIWDSEDENRSKT